MKEITADELKAKLETGEPVAIVDIREANEYEGWHIDGASNIPVYDALRLDRDEELRSRASSLPRDRPVVAVCRAGVVSRRAAGVLDALGFDASSLVGGMRGWGAVWSEARVPLSEPGATLVQIRRNGKGCLSYLIGSDGEGAVVDPCVDVSAYVDAAARLGLKPTLVLETHVHADHLSRARALCEATGATLVLPSNDRVAYPYTPVADGATLAVGSLTVEVVATPGHTGESVCYRVGRDVLLTGDTLFVDAVGRPDLERGDQGAEPAARLLHSSLHSRLLDRFDDARVYPAHHAGAIAFDGSPVGTSLARLRARLELLGRDEDDFVSTVLRGLKAKPPNYETIIAVNEGKLSLGPIDPLDVEAGPNRCAAC